MIEIMQLTGERRAIASAVFVLYGLFYLALGLLELQPGWGPAYYAMAALYGAAFFGVVAGYFWARWYAMGIAISGVLTGVIGAFQLGPEPIILFIGGTHGVAALMLLGKAMREPFEGQRSWRERLHMDEQAVVRLGKSVTRASVSLPYVLLYALAPKPGAEMLIWMLGATGLVLSLRAMVAGKTAGILGLPVTGALVLGLAGGSSYATLAAGLLFFAFAPFAGAVARSLRSPS